jgi:hypothetical protein
MTDEHRMEQLSRAYAQAVAAVCGCVWSAPVPDYGTDLTLRQVTLRQKKWSEVGPPLNIQLRSTSGATVTPTHVVYDLDANTYKLLRRATVGVPIILVLLVLPAERAEWIHHTEDRLELRRCAYWLSLRGWPASTNTSSIRIQIPRVNQFTPAALTRIMETVRQRRGV